MATNRVERVHTTTYLRDYAIGLRPTGLIADRIAPPVRVAKQSDKYRVFGKNVLIDRTGATEWHPGTIPNAIDTRWSDATYYAKLHKLRQLLLDHEVANADSDLNLRMSYTEFVVTALEIAREARVAALFTTAANYSAGNVITKAGGQEWNVVPANVLPDLDSAITKAKQGAFRLARELTVVIPDTVFDQSVKRNSAVLDAIKYTERGVATEDILANLLGVREVIIGAAQKVAAGPETPDADVITGYTATQIWTDTVWVGYVNPDAADNPVAPTFARSFNWAAGTDNQLRRTREYRTADEGQEGDWIEVTEAFDEKITFKDAGAIIVNTLSTI